MAEIKAIETEYKGYRFRSRLEARWAVFFDACGIKWEYEPEGFDLGDGIWYLPDFLLHGVDGRSTSDLWVEVKGKMTEKDAEKIKRFSNLLGEPFKESLLESPYMEYREGYKGLYVVGDIPDPTSFNDYIYSIDSKSYDSEFGVAMFNFNMIDGDFFGAIPIINNEGYFELAGDDSNYLWDADEERTLWACKQARQARFEHGEKPVINNY